MLTERLIHRDFRDLAAVQAEHEARLLALPNVVGVALGNKLSQGLDTGKRCLTVLVDMKLDKDMLGQDELVPSTIGQVPTDVCEVGVLQAGAGPTLAPPLVADWVDVPSWERDHPVDETMAPQREQRTALTRATRSQAGPPSPAGPVLTAARQRPAIGGLSVGHYRGTAGTIGICCYDSVGFDAGLPHRYYLLSNNHVLANCNDATMGDPILQPAPGDGGSPATDTIARLARFVPLHFAFDTEHVPINYVDAAIAEGRFDQLDRRIHWIGDVQQVNPTPDLGSWVQKCGRATGYTTGTIIAVNATVNVHYPGGRIARFAKQIICHGLSNGGDSGALVTDFDQRAIGLLFAATPTISVLNPITLIEQLLDIRIAPVNPKQPQQTTKRQF